MATGIDPTVDYVFKRLCGDEENAPLLVDLLNGVLDFPPGRTVSGVRIRNPFVAKDYAKGKVSLLDVRARDDPGREFLLEMQRIVRAGFAKRVLYYWAGSHAEQLLQGERYEMLLPTYSICFINERLFRDSVYHHTFRVCDEAHGVVFCKDLEIHVLELSKFAVPVEEVKTSEERWCYFFKHGASLDPDAFPVTLDVPVIRRAVEVLVRISQDDIEHQRFLERERVRQDAESLAADARVAQEELRAAQEELRAAQESLRAAQEKARRAEGVGRIHVLQQMLEHPETPSDELHRLPEENLLQIEDALRRELNATKATNGGTADEPPA
jgi:predicted transposase/invertase (TIGR01784 family)